MSPFDDHTSQTLQRFGFEEATFRTLQRRLRDGTTGDATNRITTEVKPPPAEDVVPLPPAGSDARTALGERGREAIRRGEVASVVLAGGMATRFGGVVKASVPAVDELSFLELKVRDAQAAAKSCGGRLPVYLMTSFATQDEVARLAAPLSTDDAPVKTFPQFISVRLTPEGEPFVADDGKPSLYAPGHGDLSFALRRSGLLAEFRASGGKLLYMSNVDNLLATLDPEIVGFHLAGKQEITVEAAPKLPGDKGGAPAFVDGRTLILESFRFPEDFDQDSIDVFNTNTLLLDAEAIDRDFELTWFAVRKSVEGREAIQFERLVGELTSFLPSRFLRVSRDGAASRFAPVKDPDELERRRPEIREALAARGIL